MWGGLLTTGGLLLTAMAWYPGANVETSQGHAWLGDFLSNMGRTRVGPWDNTTSCLLFNGMLLLAGAVLAVFWRVRASFLTWRRAENTLKQCGMAMGVAIGGIGLAPCDHLPNIHNLMTYVAIALGVICFALCAFASREDFESSASRQGWLAVLVAGGAAQALCVFFVFQGSMPTHPALPVMQKVFVLLLAVWMAWQGHLFGRASRLHLASSPDRHAAHG
jgi:hypothetical protein